jgi:hypothetical protein
MKNFRIFEGQLWREGAKTRSLPILAADSSEAMSIAQKYFQDSMPALGTVIKVKHEPNAFTQNSQCHG